ncbi:hypothetical protein JKA74_14480 [Marivirga sp. S37H4]|uniref:Tetratricopeptide repeat protein n=1 Tax=Marivirga aurantiaca TaxID=2802615 RepID=A0A934WZU5_9BACT|nr:hypothetical protein [Marivirga aurantiaca]MBK6266249.1 hypothetical protein [Marivirga aurantiaca]
MDKSRLTTLIKEPHQLAVEDAEALRQLKLKYPYFQALTPLMVLSDQKHHPEAVKHDLQTAAIYSLDRKHLKHLLITANNNNSSELVVAKSQEVQRNNKAKNVPAHSTTSTNTFITTLPDQDTHLPDSFFHELLDEMESLKKSKEHYRKTLAKLEEAAPEAKKKAKSTKKKSKEAVEKKQAIALEEQENHHDLIEEIESREQKAIKDQHKKEQIELITSFIEKEPIISKKFASNDPDTKKVIEDLSLSSTNLSEDVISETLAKLMVKQGRNQKAIDIYKKLIWKFPQKKTYFAEQIENLKKEQ